MEKRQVPIDRDMNAVIPYDPAFRFMVSKDDLSEYNKGFVNWHRQPTIEISIVYDGAVKVLTLEHEEIVTAGNGFFILPGFLHSVCPAPGYETAKYFTLIFHPEILYGFAGSYYEKAYYHPVTKRNIPLFVFNQQAPWTKEIVSKLEWIAGQCTDEFSDKSPAFRLQIQHILQNAWVLLAENLPNDAKTVSCTHDTGKIFTLITYLHEHYQEKFSLTKLAESMLMSRNECCRYFKRMTNMTITEYLLEYRLAKAAALLESSSLTITEISEQTGFCDVSYFIKVFRQKVGITPKAYSKNFESD